MANSKRPVGTHELSIAEWAVLGIVGEQRTHGFAIAREFAPAGTVGKIWTLPRPLVYRAITTLTEQGLIKRAGSASGDGGPQRSLVRISDTGKTAIQQWLEEPVEHVRDARSHLMLKMLLLERSGKSWRRLIQRQRKKLVSMIASLESLINDADGFDRIILQWRLSNAHGLDSFLEGLGSSNNSRR